ncbi:hypothetical protein [Massilia niastensis]|uniref:hypothetical protein n=1 Tax=Massilia niastensis TaxID=544911 RepID=UPI00036F17CE|nr:hypothetical protein [Massilia niastensis]
MKKVLLAVTAALSLGVGAMYVAEDGVTFVARNVGTEPMRSVVVHVTGRSYPIGDLAPGASKSVRVSPTSESNIELSQSGHARLTVGGYFEKGYRGTISADVTTESVVMVRDEVML